ncbi:hypothetical protein DW056_09435 [Parabacteroides distasonis]|nr:hypothetical protein DW056_09435 [Parabacteroides distasonis]
MRKLKQYFIFTKHCDFLFKISDIKHLKYDDEEGELEIFLTDDTQITLHAGFFESFERYEEFFALLKK